MQEGSRLVELYGTDRKSRPDDYSRIVAPRPLNDWQA